MRGIFFVLYFMVAAGMAQAQEFRALARAVAEGSLATDAGQGVEISVALTQSVPFRVTTHADPYRLVIDAREVDWSALDATFDQSSLVHGVQTGRAVEAAGWSRMALTLSAPFAVETAAMETDEATGAARIVIALGPATEAEFAVSATSAPAPVVAPARPGDDRFVVALDPGHGGVDPGAEADGVREADLMLTFARELSEALIRTGEVEVVLTRHDDSFVSLPERITVARAGGADVFVSLHADAIAFGSASGATVYTLAEDASDAASASLAEQHDRTDLLQGVDLNATGDDVADVLMSLARRDTAPRADALADQIVDAFRAAEVPLHPQPRLSAGFSVLRAADIPSVLLEVGFLSNPIDRARIEDENWRGRVQSALVTAILDWAAADAVAADLRLR